jgi:hypothetical protein
MEVRPFRQGIRIGSVKDGKVTAFIPEPSAEAGAGLQQRQAKSHLLPTVFYVMRAATLAPSKGRLMS